MKTIKVTFGSREWEDLLSQGWFMLEQTEHLALCVFDPEGYGTYHQAFA